MENQEDKIKTILEELLPQKSKEMYNKWYQNFIDWINKNNINKINENIMLLYFDELSKLYAPNSLWTIHSCIKKKLILEKNIDIKNYGKIIALLKSKNSIYKAKKAKVFTREDIDNYLRNADDKLCIREKLILIIAISGGMRCDELKNLKFEDIKINDDGLKIIINKSKTDRAENGFEFFVLSSKENWKDCKYYYNKYINLIEKKEGRFFRQERNNKFTSQVCGRNYFLNVPKYIAKYLNKEDWKLYTGHALRRTAATWIANAGACELELKKWGRWSSDKIAGGYVERSDPMKRKFASMLLGEEENKNIKKNNTLLINSNESIIESTEKKPNNLNCNNQTKNLEINEENKILKNIIGNLTLNGGTINININNNK